MHPGIEDAKVLAQDPILLAFYYASIKQAEREQHEWFEKSMGIMVSAMQIHRWAATSSEKSDGPPPEWLHVPFLAQMKGSEYYKEWAKTVRLPGGKGAPPPVVGQGDYHGEEDEEIIPLVDAPKGEWMDHVRRTGIYDPKVLNNMEAQRKARQEDPQTQIEREMELRARDKKLDQVSKAEFQEKTREALGQVPPKRKDEE